MIKTPAFLFPAIWSHLAQSWPGLKYMYEAKYKALGNRSIIIITFPLQPHLAFLKDYFFVFVIFVLVATYISVSLLGNR